MNTFTRKGYGRIYVDKPENVAKVEDEIKAMDDYEFGYMPTGFVASFDQYPVLVYTHKFSDLDLTALTVRCWKMGIYIWCYDNGYEEYIAQ